MPGGYKPLWIAFGLRLLLASLFFILATVLLLRAGENVPKLLAGMFFLLIGCVILARPFAYLLAEPFGSIFYPVEHFSGPQPIYSIPEARIQERKFEEAITLYQEITEQYPHQVKAYIGMMKIAGMYLKDARRSERIFHQGLLELPRKKDKDNLAIAYKALRSYTEEKPEWTEKRVISLKRRRKPDD